MYCLIRRNISKNQIYEDWGKFKSKNNFLHHRTRGPAIQEILTTNTSVDVRTSWYFEGRHYTKEKDCSILSGYNIENNSPSIIWNNGTKEWRREDRLHRYDGPAVTYSNGDQEYWLYGERHNKNGPAVIYGKKQYYFENGKFIRETK
ncbi:MAG: hypothetical protein EKK64_06605 [Neisseriaceae bacterium]|nr:MAG: hypothetical protein EKK64_06605 [Neisseriaceae bacterium]